MKKCKCCCDDGNTCVGACGSDTGYKTDGTNCLNDQYVIIFEL
jgi:hypothetical protein